MAGTILDNGTLATLGLVGLVAAAGAVRRDGSRYAKGSPAKLGPMMEGFADLVHPRRGMVPLAEGPEGAVQFRAGKRDEDGDLDLDILQLKVRGKIVSASAGELSLGPLVFVEHNTFTKPEHRGKGYMYRLYAMLLESGFIVVSDQWNHSAPMLAVWRRLARERCVLVPGEYGGTYQRLSGTDPNDPLLNERFLAFPTSDCERAERMAEEVMGELGLDDWYGTVVDDGWRPGGGGLY